VQVPVTTTDAATDAVRERDVVKVLQAELAQHLFEECEPVFCTLVWSYTSWQVLRVHVDDNLAVAGVQRERAGDTKALEMSFGEHVSVGVASAYFEGEAAGRGVGTIALVCNTGGGCVQDVADSGEEVVGPVEALALWIVGLIAGKPVTCRSS